MVGQRVSLIPYCMKAGMECLGILSETLIGWPERPYYVIVNSLNMSGTMRLSILCMRDSI